MDPTKNVGGAKWCVLSTLVFLLSEQVVISKQGEFFMKFVEMSRLC